MEDGWEEMGEGNVPMEPREQHRVWPTTAVTKNVSFISLGKGEAKVAFVVDKQLSTAE